MIFPRPTANPIVIKELRQAVRSRFVAGALCLFLLVELIATAIVLIGVEQTTVHNPSAIFNTGRTMFHTIFGILTLVCFLFIPCYAGIRMLSERWGGSIDLLFITTIKPGQIARGKLMSSMAVAVLMISAALPFLTFTYLLRGIDMFAVGISLGLTLMVVILCTQAANLVALLPTGRAFKILLSFGGVFGLFIVYYTINAGAVVSMMGMGWGIGVGGSQIWLVIGVTTGLMIAAMGLLHVLGVALLSPPAANRALPIRIYLTVLWLIGYVVAAVTTWVQSDETALEIWFVFSVIVLAVSVVVTIAEPRTMSYRVRRSIPRHILPRMLVFPFFAGPYRGLIWSLGLSALTALGYAISVAVHSSWSVEDDIWNPMIILLLYAGAYGLTALLICRTLLKRFLPPLLTSVVLLILWALGSVLPLIAAFLFDAWNHRIFGAWCVGNIFTLGYDDAHRTHLIFASAWLAIIAVAHLPWIRRMLADFHPPQIAAPEPSPTEALSIESTESTQSMESIEVDRSR